jgi:4-oxalocrotonate tautomerase
MPTIGNGVYASSPRPAEDRMPLVQIDLLEGRSSERIVDLMREVTDAVSRSLEIPNDRVRVIVRDVPRTHWAVGGTSYAEQG